MQSILDNAMKQLEENKVALEVVSARVKEDVTRKQFNDVKALVDQVKNETVSKELNEHLATRLGVVEQKRRKKPID